MDDMKMEMYLSARRQITHATYRGPIFICNILLDILSNECGIKDIYVCGDSTGKELKELKYDILEEFFPEFLELYDGVFWTLQGHWLREALRRRVVAVRNALVVDGLADAPVAECFALIREVCARQLGLLDAVINHRDAVVYRDEHNDQ